MKESRRDFMKKGLLGLAGVSLTPSEEKQNDQKITKTAQENKIVYRTLGKTGIKTPVLGMGLVINTNLLPRIYDLGLNYVFTSGDYRNGIPEKMLGDFLKTKPRDSLIVSTGVDIAKYMDHKTLKFKKNADKSSLRKYLERSLKRLKTDYIDIYFLSDLVSKDTATYEPFIETVEEFKKSGKVRFIGAATHQNEPDVIRAAADSKRYDVVMTTYNFRKTNIQEIIN